MVVTFAVSIRLLKMVIESDFEVIDVIHKSVSFVNWDYVSVLIEIYCLADECEFIDFVFTPKSTNRAAHWMASQEKKIMLPKDKFNNLPEELSKILKEDFDVSEIG